MEIENYSERLSEIDNKIDDLFVPHLVECRRLVSNIAGDIVRRSFDQMGDDNAS